MFNFPMIGGLSNLFGGDSEGSLNLFGGSEGGQGGLPNVLGVRILRALGGQANNNQSGESAESGQSGSVRDSAVAEKESVASDLAANRAEDAKLDKYTNMIPFAGPFITMGRQNDRKLGSLLSSYYRMTTPSDTANPNATVVGGLSGSSFLGRV